MIPMQMTEQTGALECGLRITSETEVTKTRPEITQHRIMAGHHNRHARGIAPIACDFASMARSGTPHPMKRQQQRFFPDTETLRP
jgi:hypothetical protein